MAILAAEKTVDFFIHELIPYNFLARQYILQQRMSAN